MLLCSFYLIIQLLFAAILEKLNLSPENLDDSAMLLMMAKIQAVPGGDLDKAEKCLGKIPDLSENEANLIRGMIARSRGRPQEAREFLEKVPESYEALIILGT